MRPLILFLHVAFGAKPASQTSAFGNSAFGQPAAFDSVQPSASAFGTPSQTSAFGAPAPAASTSAFGAPAASSAFGQAKAPSAFGSSPFGQAAQPAASMTAAFNVNIDFADSIPKEEDISAADLAAFQADMFDILQIPLTQPPLSVR